MDDQERSRVIQSLKQIEIAADEVIGLKHQLVVLDKQRQKAREALRAFPQKSDDELVSIWMNNMFIKLPHDKAKSNIEKELDKSNEEYNKTRELLKEKVKILQDLQGKEEWKGFQLNPLTNQEFQNIVSAAKSFL